MIFYAFGPTKTPSLGMIFGLVSSLLRQIQGKGAVPLGPGMVPCPAKAAAIQLCRMYFGVFSVSETHWTYMFVIVEAQLISIIVCFSIISYIVI